MAPAPIGDSDRGGVLPVPPEGALQIAFPNCIIGGLVTSCSFPPSRLIILMVVLQSQLSEIATLFMHISTTYRRYTNPLGMKTGVDMI